MQKGTSSQIIYKLRESQEDMMNKGMPTHFNIQTKCTNTYKYKSYQKQYKNKQKNIKSPLPIIIIIIF